MAFSLLLWLREAMFFVLLSFAIWFIWFRICCIGINVFMAWTQSIGSTIFLRHIRMQKFIFIFDILHCNAKYTFVARQNQTKWNKTEMWLPKEMLLIEQIPDQIKAIAKKIASIYADYTETRSNLVEFVSLFILFLFLCQQ